MGVKEQKGNLNTWLLFLGFLFWVVVTTIPDMRQHNTIVDNRDGILCLLDQLSEHRVNNRQSHDHAAMQHTHPTLPSEMNIPIEVANIPDRVCDKWLVSPESTTTQDN